MGIKRGTVKQESGKIVEGSQRRFGPKTATITTPGKSNSEARVMSNSSGEVNASSLQNVSEERRAELTRGAGFSTNPSTNPGPVLAYSSSYKENQAILKKYAITTTNSASSGFGGGGGDTVIQGPEIYSPLFQMANLQLPRDRITMNAWNRNFYDTHPLVHNCINLHSTYPISKIHIKCKHKKIEQFFSDMMEEMDMLGILQDIALEFFKVGEVFPRAELDPDRGVWKNVLLQNPDYIHVKRSVLGGDPVISLRPDAALKRLVTSNHPSDIQLRNQIDEEVLYHIRKGHNIPLDNFHVSHLKMTSSPYDIRGTSIIVSIYKDLMLYDQLRESKFAQAGNLINPITLVSVGGSSEENYHPSSEDLEQWRQTLECHDEETEVLTDAGFKCYDEVMDFSENEDGTYSVAPKDGVKIGCFNKDTEELEYHNPEAASLYNHSGDMYHFKNTKIDVKVTPNHDMWVSQKKYEFNGSRAKRKTHWGEWEKVKAEDLSIKDYVQFRSCAKWEGESVETVDILGKDIPIKLYLEFLGYVLSEGCLYEPKNLIGISQTFVKYQKEMSDCMNKFASYFGVHVSNNIRAACAPRQKLWDGKIINKPLFDFIKNEVSSEDGKHKSYNKRVPRWILNLNSELLEVILDALVKGDGSILPRRSGISAWSYASTSKQLADDVCEMAFKCGYSPTVGINYDNRGDRKRVYVAKWSTTNVGAFPKAYKTFRNSVTKEKTNMLSVEKYDGRVWCFTVPTGLFVTRRNGKITIQGNSASYDKDFKIISHAGVKIERIGASGAIIDISGDMNFIVDNILYGLMTPKAVLTQEGASYNSASIGLEVLKQRYETFRNMIARWLKVKIFAPISEIQGFYEYDGGDKKLIVPDIDWNQMILFDMNDYIGVLKELTQPGMQGEPPKVSTETLFKSLGLDPEAERRRVRAQMIQDIVAVKEKQMLQSMSVSELRALKDDEILVEPTRETGLAGTPGYDAGMGGGMGAPGGGGLGGGLGMPPMGPSGGLGGGAGPDLGGGLGGPDLGGDLGGGGAAPGGTEGPPVV